MSVNISGPGETSSKAGLRASIGYGVNYAGVESLNVPGDDRWFTGAGFNFDAVPCTTLKNGAICVNERPFTPTNPLVIEGKALNLEAQVQCSTWGTDQEKLEDLAKEVFTRNLFASISSEIWSGATARAASFTGNQYLANEETQGFTVLKGTATPRAEAIGLLDEYLSCCNPTSPGLIHVPVKAYSALGQENLLTETGSFLRQTWGGNSVVGECGYAGTGPDTFANGPVAPAAGTAWFYATGPMFIRAAANLEPLTQIDMEQNDISTVIQGAYAYGWGCCHAAILVDLDA